MGGLYSFGAQVVAVGREGEIEREIGR